MIAAVKLPGCPIMCCGQKMKELIPGTSDGAHEKHVPVFTVENNIVTVIDATRAQRILAGLNTDSNPTHVKNVDADNDGALTILDATRIQRVIAGLCDWNGNIREPDELPFVPAH